MYELIQAGPNSYYIESPAKIGLYLANEQDVYLIDSGNDKDAGRKVRQILEKNNWNLIAIFNTHANADHIGGNRYLQNQTGCKIYAPGIDCDVTNHPILEPAFLYGGFPPKDLRHKFLLAQESFAEPLTKDVLPEGLEMIKLPGHFFDMVGFRTKDNVVYLADCLSSRETLDKYQIGYIYDVGAYLETLEEVKEMDGDVFIPAHTKAMESAADLRDLAQYNIDKVNEIKSHILDICADGPLNTEDILKRLFDDYGLVMNFEQYVLVGSTLRCYLAWLKDGGLLAADFSGNMLKWAAVK